MLIHLYFIGIECIQFSFLGQKYFMSYWNMIEAVHHLLYIAFWIYVLAVDQPVGDEIETKKLPYVLM